MAKNKDKNTGKFLNLIEKNYFNTYLKDIGNEQLLSGNDEIKLTKSIKENDQKAFDKLIRSNLRFVVSVAKQYQGNGISLNDLINEGNLGLIRAVKRFDETKCCKFISYAVWWIRQSILQAINEYNKTVRLPLNRIGTFNRLSRISANLEQELKRKPTLKEIAQTMNLEEKEVCEVVKTSKHFIHLDAPLFQDDSYNLSEVLVDTRSQSTDDNLIKESLKSSINNVLLLLSERESNVVRCYFGFESKQMTLDEIGNEMGLTRERVRQIEAKAIRKIRNLKICDELRDYLNQDLTGISNVPYEYKTSVNNFKLKKIANKSTSRKGKTFSD